MVNGKLFCWDVAIFFLLIMSLSYGVSVQSIWSALGDCIVMGIHTDLII